MPEGLKSRVIAPAGRLCARIGPRYSRRGAIRPFRARKLKDGQYTLVSHDVLVDGRVCEADVGVPGGK